MKISKKQIGNYTIVANYLNMRSFKFINNEDMEAIKKVDAKLKRLHKTFENVLSLAKEQERKDKKYLERRDKLLEVGAQFSLKTKGGIASTIQYAKPYHFMEHDFLRGLYRSNKGGGNFGVSLKIGEKFNVNTYIYDNWNVYAKSCKYAAKDYDIIITLPKRGQFQLIGGLWTYTANYNRKGCRAEWVEQNVLKCYPVSGFLVNGYHVCDKNVKSVKQAREFVLAIRLKERARNLRLTKKTYTLQDSLDHGNCRAGSLAFANAHEIDPNGTYTGAYLLSIATAQEIPFVKRFVK